jgi:hypothetical protein
MEQWTTLQNCVVDQQIKAQTEQAERQRISSKIESDRIDRANTAARAVFAAKKQYGPVLETTEGREFILPILQAHTSCAYAYENVGGSVLGRSIEGNIGVILVNIVAINKTERVIQPNSGDGCTNSSRPVNPGDAINIEAKGMFRKYDTGWRFERMVN